MTTREQLEAEAEELYPVLNWDPYHQEPVETYGYEECQQEAHIRAKTISAEQWEASARAIQRQYDPYTPFENELESDQDEYFRQAHAAFEAAGFYVEAPHE